MTSFHSYLLRKIYKKVQKQGDRLAKIQPHIDWNAFTPIIQSIYTNNTPMGGRPNVDLVVMMKLLVLQSWYGRARGGVGIVGGEEVWGNMDDKAKVRFASCGV